MLLLNFLNVKFGEITNSSHLHCIEVETENQSKQKQNSRHQFEKCETFFFFFFVGNLGKQNPDYQNKYT